MFKLVSFWSIEECADYIKEPCHSVAAPAGVFHPRPQPCRGLPLAAELLFFVVFFAAPAGTAGLSTLDPDQGIAPNPTLPGAAARHGGSLREAFLSVISHVIWLIP